LNEIPFKLYDHSQVGDLPHTENREPSNKPLYLSQAFIICPLIQTAWNRQLVPEQFTIVISYKEMKLKQLEAINRNAMPSTYN